MTTVLNAGDRVPLADGVEVGVLASAHEELQKKMEAAHGSLDIMMPEIDRAILTGRTGCKT